MSNNIQFFGQYISINTQKKLNITIRRKSYILALTEQETPIPIPIPPIPIPNESMEIIRKVGIARFNEIQLLLIIQQ